MLVHGLAQVFSALEPMLELQPNRGFFFPVAKTALLAAGSSRRHGFSAWSYATLAQFKNNLVLKKNKEAAEKERNYIQLTHSLIFLAKFQKPFAIALSLG